MSRSRCWSSPKVGLADEQFAVRVSAGSDHHTVYVSGQLDLLSRDSVVRACLEPGHRCVIVDLSGLTFLDCAGYEALVETRRNLEERGGSMTLVNSVGQPARLLELIASVEPAHDRPPATAGSSKLE